MSDGWFYKQDGQAVGPVSTAALRELLAVGQVRPDQPVGRQNGPNLTFVNALAATDSSAQLPDRLRRFDGHPERAGSRPKEGGGCISKGA